MVIYYSAITKVFETFSRSRRETPETKLKIIIDMQNDIKWNRSYLSYVQSQIIPNRQAELFVEQLLVQCVN